MLRVRKRLLCLFFAGVTHIIHSLSQHIGMHRFRIRKDSVVVLSAVRHRFLNIGHGETKLDELEFLFYARFYRYASFFCHHGGGVTAAELTEVIFTDAKNCRWVPYAAVCHVKPGSKAGISTSGSGPVGIAHLLSETEPLRTRVGIGFAVCLPLLYFFTYWPILIQMIELWKAQGAGIVIAHVESINEDALHVLKAYESAEFLRIKFWPSLPQIGTENPTFYNAKALGHMCKNYCLHTLRYSAEFVITTSYDNLLVPGNRSVSLLQMFRSVSLENPEVGAFLFPEAVALLEQPCYDEIDAKTLMRPFRRMQKEPCNKGGICGVPQRTLPVLVPRHVKSTEMHERTSFRGHFTEKKFHCGYGQYLHFRLSVGTACAASTSILIRHLAVKAERSLNASLFDGRKLRCKVSEYYPIHKCYNGFTADLYPQKLGYCWFEFEVCRRNAIVRNCLTFSANYRKVEGQGDLYVRIGPAQPILSDGHCSSPSSPALLETRNKPRY